MDPCPRVSRCPMFSQMAMKVVLGVWRTFYCEGDYGRCERWKLLSAGKAVPPKLLPNGRTLEVPIEQLEPKHFS